MEKGDKVITWDGRTGTIIFIDNGKYFVVLNPFTTCQPFSPNEIRLDNQVKVKKKWWKR